ncbi:MAG: right-handed parallel beta-helix repeat-containing protein [Phycisphaerae bacterium]|nr:right-handed parallel beta-helix repeat-containing protein [Phycisphaerae bacterium]
MLTSVQLVILLSCGVGSGELADPAAVQEVVAGKRVVANAAWWGFDREDSTRSIQAAIDSGARKVIVPFVGADWIVTPIRLRSGLELVFEPGVVVLAKKGEFLGKGDSLLSASDASDITIRGYGATLRMRKKDYQKAPYAKAEWRTCLDLQGCRRIRVEGVRLESSGGDGIYLGATGKLPYCQDVVIRDVVCHDHHRQGISVIGAVNLLIENCVLSDTNGTAPQAGIDFEPNQAREKLVNCVMRNCLIENNTGAGVLIYLKHLSAKSDPVSLLVEGCLFRGGKDVGVGVGAVKDDGPKGTIEFRDCTIEGTRNGGVYIYDKSADNARVRFVNCKWKDVGIPRWETGKGPREPGVAFLLTLMRPALTKKHGGIDFVDCHVYDTLDRPVLVAEDEGAKLGVHDVRGRITVHNPHGARMDLKCAAEGVDVKLVGSGK